MKTAIDCSLLWNPKISKLWQLSNQRTALKSNFFNDTLLERLFWLQHVSTRLKATFGVVKRFIKSISHLQHLLSTKQRKFIIEISELFQDFQLTLRLIILLFVVHWRNLWHVSPLYVMWRRSLSNHRHLLWWSSSPIAKNKSLISSLLSSQEASQVRVYQSHTVKKVPAKCPVAAPSQVRYYEFWCITCSG